MATIPRRRSPPDRSAAHDARHLRIGTDETNYDTTREPGLLEAFLSPAGGTGRDATIKLPIGDVGGFNAKVSAALGSVTDIGVLDVVLDAPEPSTSIWLSASLSGSSTSPETGAARA